MLLQLNIQKKINARDYQVACWMGWAWNMLSTSWIECRSHEPKCIKWFQLVQSWVRRFDNPTDPKIHSVLQTLPEQCCVRCVTTYPVWWHKGAIRKFQEQQMCPWLSPSIHKFRHLTIISLRWPSVWLLEEKDNGKTETNESIQHTIVDVSGLLLRVYIGLYQ